MFKVIVKSLCIKQWSNLSKSICQAEGISNVVIYNAQCVIIVKFTMFTHTLESGTNTYFQIA